MANGGITIATISDIKLNWDAFIEAYKKLLTECAEILDDGSTCHCNEAMAKIEKLPNQAHIHYHYDFMIFTLINSIVRECETPYIFDKYIAVGWGSTNSCTMNHLSTVLENTCKGFSIETWT